MYSIVNSPISHEPKNPIGEPNLIKSLPLEICLKIFSYLNGLHLNTLKNVNRVYKILADDETLWKALPTPETAFNKENWNIYFGKVTEPSLPKNIELILASSCPFYPGKKIEETHRLLLIPGSVDGKPLTLNLLIDLFKTPKIGYPFRYRYIWSKILENYGQQELPNSYWVLMTKDLIEGSRNQKYPDQQALLTKFTKNKKNVYRTPTLVEAMICEYVKYAYGERGLGDWWPYTACKEVVDDFRMMTGGFAPAGIDTFDCSRGRNYIGLAAVAELFQL